MQKEAKRRKERNCFRDHLALGYDIIGDIHGHADELETLLDKLGYSSDGTCHPKGRRLIFLGDFIDRGPNNKRVIEIVQTLIRADLAFAVMGNHEYNAICYHTRAENNGRHYLREHTPKNKAQHQAFLEDYEDDKEQLDHVIRWFQRLPIFLDLGELRIVHACWEQDAIDFVETQYGNQLTNEFLHKSIDSRNKEYKAIETLLKGPERSLRPELFFSDTDGNPRTDFRLRWWNKELRTLGDAAILPRDFLEIHQNEPLSDHCEEQRITPYPEEAPPVFFGHYSALPVEESYTRNTACLDYNIIEGHSLACLRWNKAEKDLTPAEMEIVSVPACLQETR